MENPFDIIVQRLDSIEKLLNELSKYANNSKPQKDTDEIMTVEQLSDYLTIARQTIYEKCSKKEIPYFKAGKRLYFKKSVSLSMLREVAITTIFYNKPIIVWLYMCL